LRSGRVVTRSRLLRNLGSPTLVRPADTFGPTLGWGEERAMPSSRLLSPEQHAALARNPRFAAVVEVLLAAATRDPVRFPPVAHLAELMHASGRTLERRFQRDLGMSYRTFKRLLRVREAEARLSNREAGEKSVARSVGYSSPASLGRAFAHVCHVTPRGRRSRWKTRRRPRVVSGDVFVASGDVRGVVSHARAA
jgi:transcriptional regulator GlxA family with amidase domain